jgi:hypothetical protein
MAQWDYYSGTSSPGYELPILSQTLLTIVRGRVEYGWLALHPSDVSTPQVPMQHTGLEFASNILKEHLKVGTQLDTQLIESAVAWGVRAAAGQWQHVVKYCAGSGGPPAHRAYLPSQFGQLL